MSEPPRGRGTGPGPRGRGTSSIPIITRGRGTGLPAAAAATTTTTAPAGRGRGRGTGLPVPAPRNRSLPTRSKPAAVPPPPKSQPKTANTAAKETTTREHEATARRAAAAQYELERRERLAQDAAAAAATAAGDTTAIKAESEVAAAEEEAPPPADLPADLPTAYYAALAASPAPTATAGEVGEEESSVIPKPYLDYPARILHLKFPVENAHPAPDPSPRPQWEDIHLHQRVASPRVQARWMNSDPSTVPGLLARAREFFLQFNAPEYLEPFLGFRPYTDVLLLDSAYVKAYLKAADAQEGERDLVPFIAAADRDKVRSVAVAASLLGEEEAGGQATVALLAGAFPSLAHVWLVSIADVERPASAAWERETEFARWCVVGSEGGKVEAKGTGAVVAAGFAECGQVAAAAAAAEEGGVGVVQVRSPLEERVETALAAAVGHGRAVRAEALIMLYFRDAFDRACANGWDPSADRVDIDHLDLRIE